MSEERCRHLPILLLATAKMIFSTIHLLAAHRSRTPAFARAAWFGRLKPWLMSPLRHHLNTSSSGQKLSIAMQSTPPAKSPPASDQWSWACSCGDGALARQAERSSAADYGRSNPGFAAGMLRLAQFTAGIRSRRDEW